jgi:hypothetical protein
MACKEPSNTRNRTEYTDLIVFHAGEAIFWNGPPFAVSANPEFGMHFISGDHFTPENVTHEKVIVHRVGDNLGYRG